MRLTVTNKLANTGMLFLAGCLLVACGSGSSRVATSSISYQTLNNPLSQPGDDNVFTGIRQVTESGNVYITGGGSLNESAYTFLYSGPLNGGGTYYYYSYPSTSNLTVKATTLYGPNNGSSPGQVQLVGEYKTDESAGYHFGFLYQGAENGSTVNGWMTFHIPESFVLGETVYNTYAHSTMGNLVVGNYDTESTIPQPAEAAFIYDITTQQYFKLNIPGSLYTTAYGIWQNNSESYTIAGGYSSVNALESQASVGYLVDWNNTTHSIVQIESFTYNNLPGDAVITHFEGITTDNNGGYYLAADAGFSSNSLMPALVHVPRNADGTFGQATWTTTPYPGAAITTANTVLATSILGTYTVTGESGSNAFIATVNY